MAFIGSKFALFSIYLFSSMVFITEAGNLTVYGRHKNFHLLPRPPTCGVSSCPAECPPRTPVGPRIKGGTDARLGEFPWMAILEINFDPAWWKIFHRSSYRRCGGSILNNLYVLTAAHCFFKPDYKFESIKLYVGDWDKAVNPDIQGETTAPLRVQVPVEKYIVHPGYLDTPDGLWNDIALVRFKHNIIFDDYMKPICLPFDHEAAQRGYEGYTMTQAGWGFYKDGKTRPTILQRYDMTFGNWETCRQAWYNEKKLVITESQTCVYTSPSAKSCSGDSGGPLMSLETTAMISEETLTSSWAYYHLELENAPTSG